MKNRRAMVSLRDPHPGSRNRPQFSPKCQRSNPRCSYDQTCFSNACNKLCPISCITMAQGEWVQPPEKVHKGEPDWGKEVPHVPRFAHTSWRGVDEYLQISQPSSKRDKSEEPEGRSYRQLALHGPGGNNKEQDHARSSDGDTRVSNQTGQASKQAPQDENPKSWETHHRPGHMQYWPLREPRRALLKRRQCTARAALTTSGPGSRRTRIGLPCVCRSYRPGQ